MTDTNDSNTEIMNQHQGNLPAAVAAIRIIEPPRLLCQSHLDDWLEPLASRANPPAHVLLVAAASPPLHLLCAHFKAVVRKEVSKDNWLIYTGGNPSSSLGASYKCTGIHIRRQTHTHTHTDTLYRWFIKVFK